MCYGHSLLGMGASNTLTPEEITGMKRNVTA